MKEEALPRGEVDWPAVVRVLREISRRSEEFLMDNALIGGAACAFYRVKLDQEGDPDFRSPPASEREEQIWLSRDIDFIGQRLDEYGAALGLEARGNPPRFYVDGVWIDSPEIGVSLDPRRCLRDAIVSSVEVEGEKVTFNTADPITLYREKMALLEQKEKRPQDSLHAGVLKEFLSLDLVKRLERGVLGAAGAKQWRDDAREIKEIDPTFHLDARYRRRVHAALVRFESGQPKAVRAYVDHHVPVPDALKQLPRRPRPDRAGEVS